MLQALDWMTLTGVSGGGARARDSARQLEDVNLCKYTGRHPYGVILGRTWQK
jgi:hypothetical protein